MRRSNFINIGDRQHVGMDGYPAFVPMHGIYGVGILLHLCGWVGGWWVAALYSLTMGSI
jgi:hypothetical protein